jgi:hypothetical protein
MFVTSFACCGAFFAFGALAFFACLAGLDSLLSLASDSAFALLPLYLR